MPIKRQTVRWSMLQAKVFCSSWPTAWAAQMQAKWHPDWPSNGCEVDAFIGLDQVADAGGIIEQVLARTARTAAITNDSWQPLNLVTRKPVYIPDYDTPRFRLTPAHTAFTKIADRKSVV